MLADDFVQPRRNLRSLEVANRSVRQRSPMGPGEVQLGLLIGGGPLRSVFKFGFLLADVAGSNRCQSQFGSKGLILGAFALGSRVCACSAWAKRWRAILRASSSLTLRVSPRLSRRC